VVDSKRTNKLIAVVVERVSSTGQQLAKNRYRKNRRPKHSSNKRPPDDPGARFQCVLEAAEIAGAD
jgi:hypothetical protein